MISGTIYGVILNDAAERTQLAPQFETKPYAAPPSAPVVYVRPRSCLSASIIPVAAGAEVRLAPTLALLFARDAAKIAASDALSCVGGAALAVDVSLPQADYYRPPLTQMMRDGFLVLGRFGSPEIPARIETEIDGSPAHAWTLDRLVRPVDDLIADLSDFMTLKAGDLLLVGLPGDAPLASAGHSVRVTAGGLSALTAVVEKELAA